MSPENVIRCSAARRKLVAALRKAGMIVKKPKADESLNLRRKPYLDDVHVIDGTPMRLEFRTVSMWPVPGSPLKLLVGGSNENRREDFTVRELKKIGGFDFEAIALRVKECALAERVRLHKLDEENTQTETNKRMALSVEKKCGLRATINGTSAGRDFVSVSANYRYSGSGVTVQCRVDSLSESEAINLVRVIQKSIPNRIIAEARAQLASLA